MKTLLEPSDIEILPQQRLQVSKTNRIPAICFYNGTFVPIHAGHISVLEHAKNYINNLGTHELLGAYVSPSHSGYVAKKLRPEEIIGAGHRLAIIDLAIENLDWVMVDLFEMFQPVKTSLSIVMEVFRRRVHAQLPDGQRIDIFWLKGEDALFHNRSPDNLLQLGFHSIYVVNRTSNSTVQDDHEKHWQAIRTSSLYPDKLHLIQGPHMNLSSSTIRACASKTSVTREQLHACIQLDKVTTYIIQHQLWNAGLETRPTTISTLSVFPTQIMDLTPELLSEMLNAYSNLSVKVLSFSFEQIGVGTGWNGTVYRLYDIQYSSDSLNCPPSSMILKLSTGKWLQRVASIEPEFYFKLAPRISNIEIPKSYCVARHPQSPNESLLLLEDLSINHIPLGSKESLDESTLFLLITSIASLHAEFFNHPLLQQDIFAWLPTLNSTLDHYQTVYACKMADQEFTQLLQSKVSPKAYTYAQRLLPHMPHLFQALSNHHSTLAHDDFWINNIFRHRHQSHRIVLFDWQTCCRANGLIDIVFFLRLLDGDRARSLEPQVLDLYHQTLIKYGIFNYAASTIRNDYYALALPFMFILIASLKNLKESKFNRIIMMLEDIVTYGTTSERIICDCDLDV